MRIREALQLIVEEGMDGTGIVDRIAGQLYEVAKATRDVKASTYLISVANDLIQAQNRWQNATGAAEQALRAIRVYQIDVEV